MKIIFLSLFLLLTSCSTYKESYKNQLATAGIAALAWLAINMSINHGKGWIKTDYCTESDYDWYYKCLSTAEYENQCHLYCK